MIIEEGTHSLVLSDSFIHSASMKFVSKGTDFRLPRSFFFSFHLIFSIKHLQTTFWITTTKSNLQNTIQSQSKQFLSALYSWGGEESKPALDAMCTWGAWPRFLEDTVLQTTIGKYHLFSPNTKTVPKNSYKKRYVNDKKTSQLFKHSFILQILHPVLWPTSCFFPSK